MAGRGSLEMRYEAQLEEYRALKSEIVANLASARQVVSLTLTAVAALIAAVPVVLERDAAIVFLIAPLLFYALAWTQLRYTFLVLDMGRYLKRCLIPELKRSVAGARAGNEADEDPARGLMDWEHWPASLLYRESVLRRLVLLPIAGANLGVPLLAALGSGVGYFLSNDADVTPLVVGLALVDGGLLLYSLYWGIRAELARSLDDDNEDCPE